MENIATTSRSSFYHVLPDQPRYYVEGVVETKLNSEGEDQSCHFAHLTHISSIGGWQGEFHKAAKLILFQSLQPRLLWCLRDMMLPLRGDSGKAKLCDIHTSCCAIRYRAFSDGLLRILSVPNDRCVSV